MMIHDFPMLPFTGAEHTTGLHTYYNDSGPLSYHSENSHYGHHSTGVHAHTTVTDVTQAEGQQLQTSASGATAGAKGAHFTGLHTYYNESGPLSYHSANSHYGHPHHSGSAGQPSIFVVDGQHLDQSQEMAALAPAPESRKGTTFAPTPGHITLGVHSMLAGAVEAYLEGPRGEPIGCRAYNARFKAKTLELAEAVTPVGAAALELHVLNDLEMKSPKASEAEEIEILPERYEVTM